jgi:hypothetical protein
LFCGTFVEETWRPRYISSSMPTLSVSGGNWIESGFLTTMEMEKGLRLRLSVKTVSQLAVFFSKKNQSARSAQANRLRRHHTMSMAILVHLEAKKWKIFFRLCEKTTEDLFFDWDPGTNPLLGSCRGAKVLGSGITASHLQVALTIRIRVDHTYPTLTLKQYNVGVTLPTPLHR